MVWLEAASIFVEVFDGDRTGAGTLEFNVVQNGQPRWLPLPAVSLTEDGQTSFNLLNYLRDTDIDGNEVSASNLAVQVRNISDETLVRFTIRDGHFLDIETVDDDVWMLELTLRASDELQVSDTVITVIVQNVNDARASTSALTRISRFVQGSRPPSTSARW